jgi:hypothetical protein
LSDLRLVNFACQKAVTPSRESLHRPTCVWFPCLTRRISDPAVPRRGRLPSRRWRIVAWAAILGAALVVSGFAFMPETLLISHPYVRNPFGVAGVIGGGLTTYGLSPDGSL